MPSGVFTKTDVPTEQLLNVISGFLVDNPIEIEARKQANGKWTVIATFP